MTEGEFPFRNFTVRAEGYDRREVDGLITEMQEEISEVRRALDTSMSADIGARGDSGLHDPEGAVARTLAIAQETADRVLHGAQVEADRRRSEADEQAAATLAEADNRAAKLMADIETQTAEVRAQGIAAARSAIQVERDKAVAELGQIRRVRDDIRAEAIELKSTLDRYARQSTEASEILGAAASGPLLASDLPEFVADDIALAGVIDDEPIDDAMTSFEPTRNYSMEREQPPVTPDRSWLYETRPAAVPTALAAVTNTSSSGLVWIDDGEDIEDPYDTDDQGPAPRPDVTSAPAVDDRSYEAPLADVIAIDGDDIEDLEDLEDLDAVDEVDDYEALPSDLDSSASSGAFLSEVRAAADDTVTLPPEHEASGESDRFLSELRGVTGSVDIDAVDLDDEVADRFFDAD